MSEEVALAPLAELGAEAVGLLQRLIRIDTSNPPGNEGKAQDLLHELLTDAGFECELAAREPERPNLVARLRGSSPGPVLCLLSHVDTVPADPSDWSADPWSGELRDGEVWGRGALDMKGQVAAEVAAAVSLARGGWRPRGGDLLVVVTADEERGAAYGARWLCAERPDLVRSDLVVNEGGGVAIDFRGRRFYTIALGEKGVARLHLRTHGRAGHASMPRIGDNALLRMAPLLERLADQPPLEPTPEAVSFLSSLLDEDLGEAASEDLAVAVDRLRAEEPALADYLAEPLLGVTLAPVMVEGGVKENVIPAHCEVLVDCRVPPELGENHVRERVAALLGDGGWEIDIPETVVGNRSKLEGPLADAIAAWLSEVDTRAMLVPIVMPGFSDSHWFRKEFGATAYGFWPRREMTLGQLEPLIHGADERVAVADVELSAGFFFDLPQRVLG
ncbi:MAG TPA: M20/M25/M40 family metallo-hydrolase [Solirubrobacterales bacterium]|jgi:acetylornithine deacetylase/succinyl-diaminopimelate desuccinylase-like protein|nr:M20/M25/M40 family metallo-hydrolase [Solirubrobacterales bacterium]